jgi:hypothetical protein
MGLPPLPSGTQPISDQVVLPPLPPPVEPGGMMTRAFGAVPSPQSVGFDYRGFGGNAALARLANPFDNIGPTPQQGAYGAAPTAEGGMGGGYPPAGAGGAPPPAPSPGAAAAPPAGAPGPADLGLGGGLSTTGGVFNMIGDQGPIGFVAGTIPKPPPPPSPNPPPGPPRIPGPRAGSSLFVAVRSMKVTENQSPRPQDRIYFDFNYYNNLNATTNRLFQVPLTDMKAYRYIFGLEKTFNDGLGSIGLRFPINTLTANSNIPNFGRTSTATGDLSIILKHIVVENRAKGDLVSVGLMVNAPTGPSNFAGARYLQNIHTTDLQPWIGYICHWNNFYFQGFSVLDVPVNFNDPTFLFNDVGVGYFLYRTPDRSRLITAIAPTFEVHVNTPLNHRDVFNRFDIAGTPDVVDLTYGLNIGFYGSSVLTLAFINPVTSPKPFDYEATVFLNIFFGRSRAGQIPITPPVVGG